MNACARVYTLSRRKSLDVCLFVNFACAPKSHRGGATLVFFRANTLKPTTHCKKMHELWQECEPIVNAYCKLYTGKVHTWSEKAKSFNPLFVIGSMFDMHKQTSLPDLRSLEEALEAEIVSVRFVVSPCVQHFVSMLYCKSYIPTTWDPIDMSAWELVSRRSEHSLNDAIATLSRVFLRPQHERASKGSASKLLCDAFRRGANLRPDKRAREEYDPYNPGIEGLRAEARATIAKWTSRSSAQTQLPPPQTAYPYYNQQQQPQMMLDMNSLNALYSSMTGGLHAI